MFHTMPDIGTLVWNESDIWCVQDKEKFLMNICTKRKLVVDEKKNSGGDDGQEYWK